MSKVFERNKPHLNVGTIGHVDHGKTTLTAAITKVASKKYGGDSLNYDQIDKTPEEKTRGITIAATVVEYLTEKFHISHVDCPGHRDFLKNFITGANNMDFAILLLDATQGAQPQTREHIILCHQMGIKQLVVFFNKMDAVSDPEMVELAEIEIQELLSGKFPDDTPIIKGSALKALEGDKEAEKSIEELIETIDKYAKLPIREVDKPFLIYVEDIFSITGRGTVATGKVEQGRVRIGDTVDVVTNGETIQTTVTGIEMFRKQLEVAEAGDNPGILLRGVKNNKKEIGRGSVVCAPGTVKPHQHCKVEVITLTQEEGGRSKPFGKGYRPQFYVKTVDMTGDIIGMWSSDGKERMAVNPGDHGVFEVKFINKMALAVGQKFSIREGGVTVGAGKVIEILD